MNSNNTAIVKALENQLETKLDAIGLPKDSILRHMSWDDAAYECSLLKDNIVHTAALVKGDFVSINERILYSKAKNLFIEAGQMWDLVFHSDNLFA